MKLVDIKDLNESESEGKANLDSAPAPGNLGQFITSAQAAVILDVDQSRIRQFVADGRLTSHKPVKGQRDHMFKQADVHALKEKERPITGRPDEGKGFSKADKKDVKESVGDIPSLLRVTAEGKPPLTKTKEELESLLRTVADDNTVDLFFLNLADKGQASFQYKGKVIHVGDASHAVREGKEYPVYTETAAYISEQIMEDAEQGGHSHEVYDRKEKKVVGKYKDAKRARTRADKLDNEYGAYRYGVRKIADGKDVL